MVIMPLLDAVEQLVGTAFPTAEAQVRAGSLRELADLIDSGDASPGVRPQLHAQLIKELDAFAAVASPSGGPRIGPVRGPQALALAQGLGYPEPERVDIEVFDVVEAVALQWARRRAGLEPNPGLQVLIESRAEEQRGSRGV